MVTQLPWQRQRIWDLMGDWVERKAGRQAEVWVLLSPPPELRGSCPLQMDAQNTVTLPAYGRGIIGIKQLT